MTNDPRLDFSFSGLKTALLYAVRELGPETRLGARRADLAASFQAAVVDQLVAKLRRAARGGSNAGASPDALARGRARRRRRGELAAARAGRRALRATRGWR